MGMDAFKGLLPGIHIISSICLFCLQASNDKDRHMGPDQPLLNAAGLSPTASGADESPMVARALFKQADLTEVADQPSQSPQKKRCLSSRGSTENSQASYTCTK